MGLPSINAARNCAGANRAVLGDWLSWVKVEELSVLMGNVIFSERGERLGFLEQNFRARGIVVEVRD